MSIDTKTKAGTVDSAQFETSSAEKNVVDIDTGTQEDVESRGFSLKDTKKLLRKMDGRLLPFLALLYLLSFLDRTNIGNARLAGLEEDLKMTGKYDYNVSFLSTLSTTKNEELTISRSPCPFSSPSMSPPRSRPTWP